MAFTQKVPTGNTPSGLSYSRGAGSGDQSAALTGRGTGVALSGIGGAVKTALAGADEVVKQKIYQEIDSGTDEVQSLFGVDAATQEQTGGPNELAAARSDIARLNNAYANGDIKASHYFGQLNAKVKTWKARYPGYEKEIDATVANITGVNPANTLVSTLRAEAEAEARSQSAAADKWLTYQTQNQEWIERAYPGYFEKPDAEKPQQAQVMSAVAKLQAQDSRLRSTSLDLEVRMKQGQVDEKEIETAAREAASTMVSQTLEAGMTSMGNSYNDILKTINSYQTSGEFASPEALQQLQMGTANLIMTTTANLQQTLSQGPYAQMSNTQRKDIIEGAVAPLQTLADAINNEDYGLIKAQAAWIEATKNANVAETLSTGAISGDNVFQNIQILKEVLPAEAFSVFLASNPDANNALKDALTLRARTATSLGTGETVSEHIKDAAKVDPSAGKAVLNSILEWLPIAVQGPGSIGANVVLALFQDSTGTINQFKESQRPDVYATMYGPRTTQGLTQLKESDPQSWDLYKGKAMQDFTEVSRPIISEINSFPEAYSDLIEVTFNRETGLLEARPIPGKFIQSTSTLTGVGGPDPVATDAALQEMIRNYQEINKMLLSLRPIVEADGGDFTASVDIFLQSMGVRYSNPLSPDERDESPDLSKLDLSTEDGGVQEFLSFVQSLEASSGFDQIYSDENKVETLDLSTMTINDVLANQQARVNAGSASSATGGLQIMKDTLVYLKDSLGLTGEEFFDEDTQRALGLALLERRGLSKYRAGTMSAEAFADSLAQEWAALPLANGKSYYSKIGKNRALTDRETFLNQLTLLDGTGESTASVEEGLPYSPPKETDEKS